MDNNTGAPRLPRPSLPTPQPATTTTQPAAATPTSAGAQQHAPAFFFSSPPPPPSTAPPRRAAAAAATTLGDELRVFAPYSIYKKRAAMQVSWARPTFASTGNAYRLERAGGMWIEFANGGGDRTYDWSTKGNIMLSPTEAAELVSGRGDVSFYHDPNKGKAGEGTVGKKLSVSPTPDATGYFFNLSVNGGANPARYAVMVSHAEYDVLKCGVQFALPHLLGWHAVFNPASLHE